MCKQRLFSPIYVFLLFFHFCIIQIMNLIILNLVLYLSLLTDPKDLLLC